MKLHNNIAGGFTLVQNKFLDQYMASANGEFVKTYLYLLRSSSAGRDVSLSSIADALNHTENDVKRALTYWEKKNLLQLFYDENGMLDSISLIDMDKSAAVASSRIGSYTAQLTEPAASGAGSALQAQGSCPASSDKEKTDDASADEFFSAENAPKITISAARKKELAAQEDIRQLIYITETYLGKKLSSTEVTHILYFYDELHFSSDLIEFLIEYCVSKGKKSIHYIRKVALEWSSKGITDVSEAKQDVSLYSKDFYAVLSAFGIKDRGPAQSEAALMSKWFQEYRFSKELVLEACKRTINRTHTPSFSYADKILESWKKSGIQRISEIDALDPAPKPAQPAEKRASSRSGSAPNRFNNFPQRNYDFDQLEKQLLDC